jgi:AhpD family alkylhydroperoxidase
MTDNTSPKRESSAESASARITVPDFDEPCCDSPPFADEPPQDASAAFGAFMKQANAPGQIDGRSKKLMAIALSVSQRCRPCLEQHIVSALKQGITRGEIDEAAQLAISFAGCPSLMMYREVCKSLGL